MATLELQTETKPEEKQVVPEGPEPLVYTTWVLKVSIHCQGCKRKIKKILTNIEGVYTTNIDMKQQKVVVTGNVEAETLIKKIVKAGRHAELWAEGPESKKPKKPKKKDKESDEEESSEEDDDGNNGENGMLMQENSKPEIKQVVSFSTGGQPPQPRADNGGVKKKKKKKKKKKNNNTAGGGGAGGGGNEGSGQPNNLPNTMIQVSDHGPPPPYTAEYSNPPYANCGYPPPQSQYHSPATTYTVCRSTAYPRDIVGAHSTVSYYAPPSYHSYGYGYPAVSGDESPPSDYDPDADQASDSIDEMFSDGNPGACFVM